MQLYLVPSFSMYSKNADVLFGESCVSNTFEIKVSPNRGSFLSIATTLSLKISSSSFSSYSFYELVQVKALPKAQPTQELSDITKATPLNKHETVTESDKD